MTVMFTFVLRKDDNQNNNYRYPPLTPQQREAKYVNCWMQTHVEICNDTRSINNFMSSGHALCVWLFEFYLLCNCRSWLHRWPARSGYRLGSSPSWGVEQPSDFQHWDQCKTYALDLRLQVKEMTVYFSCTINWYKNWCLIKWHFVK